MFTFQFKRKQKPTTMGIVLTSNKIEIDNTLLYTFHDHKDKHCQHLVLDPSSYVANLNAIFWNGDATPARFKQRLNALEQAKSWPSQHHVRENITTYI